MNLTLQQIIDNRKKPPPAPTATTNGNGDGGVSTVSPFSGGSTGTGPMPTSIANPDNNIPNDGKKADVEIGNSSTVDTGSLAELQAKMKAEAEAKAKAEAEAKAKAEAEALKKKLEKQNSE